jgi:hypothetical protein|tara:strand:+ start:33 stop:266 length:234 start_codon:yes stop_codon:yes gene_type:complete
MDISSLYTAVSDMTNLRKSVIVDMIMVQLIALTLGCFLILVFSGPKMSSSELSWIIGALFVCFSATGIVYRRLANQG